jgi:hypothetical protein
MTKDQLSCTFHPGFELVPAEEIELPEPEQSSSWAFLPPLGRTGQVVDEPWQAKQRRFVWMGPVWGCSSWSSFLCPRALGATALAGRGSRCCDGCGSRDSSGRVGAQ